MFEAVGNFYIAHQDFLNGVATTVTILAASFGVARYFQSKQKRIYYHWDRIDLLPRTLPSGFRLEISNRNGSGEGLLIDAVNISNRSGITLTDSDFVKPIHFKLKDDKTVYQAEVYDANNGASGHLEFNSGKVELRELTIPRNESLTLLFSHDSAIEKGIFATPKSLPDLKEKEPVKASQTALVQLANLVFLAATATAIYVYLEPFGSEKSEFSWARFLISLALYLACFFSCETLVPNAIGRLLRPFLGITENSEKLSDLSPVSLSEQITKLDSNTLNRPIGKLKANN